MSPHTAGLVHASYGFRQKQSLLDILAQCANQGLAVDLERVIFYLGHETLVLTSGTGMRRWRKALFSFLWRNASPAYSVLEIPAHRVVELGAEIEL